MAIKPLLTFPNTSLKSKARIVTRFDDDLRQLVDDMLETMRNAPGVGLAAPQIGVQLRVVVIAGQVTRPDKDNPAIPEAEQEGILNSRDSTSDEITAKREASQEAEIPPLVLINPVIVAASGEQVDEEGCLSVLDYSTKVKRFARIRVKALALDQTNLEFEAEDFFARVIQHELDHLDGTLFIDRISSLKRSLYRRKLKKILQVKNEQA